MTPLKSHNCTKKEECFCLRNENKKTECKRKQTTVRDSWAVAGQNPHIARVSVLGKNREMQNVFGGNLQENDKITKK